MRQAGEVTYADAHKQRKNEGYIFKLLFLIKPTVLLNYLF